MVNPCLRCSKTTRVQKIIWSCQFVMIFYTPAPLYKVLVFSQIYDLQHQTVKNKNTVFKLLLTDYYHITHISIVLI